MVDTPTLFIRIRRWTALTTVGALMMAGCVAEDQSGGSAANRSEPSGEDATAAEDRSSEPAFLTTRTDVTTTGNRQVTGRGSVMNQAISVDLPDEPLWVLDWPSDDDRSWLVTLKNGDTVVVTENGELVDVDDVPADVASGGPPLVTVNQEGPVVGSAHDGQSIFGDPLPDSRVVVFRSPADDTVTAALVGPTDRYAHDVLGDPLEASAVEVIDSTVDEPVLIEVEESAVIEGISPLLADVDDDGFIDVLVTVSDANVGAKLVAYRLDGTLIAESDPIGRGNRWRNQLAVGPIGPNGEVEVVDVRTPHIGGTVEFFRVVDDRLELVAASEPNFTSHVIGTRNLDMAMMADGDGDGVLDIIVPTQNRESLAVLTRNDGGVDVQETPVDGTIKTNLAVRDGAQTAFAVGTSGGTAGDALVIWPALDSAN